MWARLCMTLCDGWLVWLILFSGHFKRICNMLQFYTYPAYSVSSLNGIYRPNQNQNRMESDVWLRLTPSLRKLNKHKYVHSTVCGWRLWAEQTTADKRHTHTHSHNFSSSGNISYWMQTSEQCSLLQRSLVGSLPFIASRWTNIGVPCAHLCQSDTY